MIRLVDRLLETGLNKDGVWISRIKPSTGEIIDERHAHCWGYLFNAVYTTWLISGEQRFLQATQQALQAVTENPAYLDDPLGSGRNYGSNAYSDAIESAIVFLNRLPNKRTSAVVDTCVKRFLGRQRDDGIIEDWYGDGNYVRTALMFALMKSQGAWLEPWRADLSLGAVSQGETLLLTLECESSWEGIVRFDVPRHCLHFNLPVNYPRLNEFPEWFVVDQDALYRVDIQGQLKRRTGGELKRGLAVQAEPTSATIITIQSLPGPPYKGKENRQNRTLDR